MTSDLTTYFDVVYKHTPSIAFIGITTIKNNQTDTRFYRYGNDLTRAITDITKLNVSTNIYARITPLQHLPKAGRGLAKDSLGSSVVWCDLDCYDPQQKTAALDALRSFSSPPTLIVDSGGGLHAYWLLNSFLCDLATIEAHNRWLYQQFTDQQSDTVFDLARILRLPATFNLKHDPPLQAKIVWYDATLSYDHDTFNTATDDHAPVIYHWDHAPLPGSFAANINDQDRKLYSYMTDLTKATKMFGTNGGLDRSALDAYCVTRLLGLGYPPEQCMSVLLDTRFLTSAKYQDTQRFDYVVLTVNNCYHHFINQPDQYFNKSRFQAKEMAQVIVGNQQQFIHTADNLWEYQHGAYRNNAEHVIKAEIVKRLGQRWSKHSQDELLEYIKSAYYVPLEQCNQRSDEYINCRNGMLNIATNILEPHDQKYRSLYQLPANYDASVDTTLVDWFIKSILPEDTIPFFWEFLGSALLTNQYWPKAFLLLIGDGDSGKSTMLRFIRAVLGDENCSKITLQALADNRFMTIKLYGKLANIFADLSETEAGDVGQIKALTGDDMIHGEEKFEKGFAFTNVARLIFSANNYPTVKNADQAFFNRAKLIRCSNNYSGKKADESLSQRLSQPENLSAALLRMYQGLQRIIAAKAFTASLSMQVELERYQTYADSVYGFLAQCRYAVEYQTPKQVLFKSYSDSCKFAGRQPVTENSFYQRLNKQAQRLHIGEERPEINEKRVWCYTGIKPPTDVATFYLTKAIGVN